MSQLFASSGQSIGASASVLSMNNSRLISFRIDWFDLLAVQRTLKSLLQHHNSKASILQHSAFFMVQLSCWYMTTGKTIKQFIIVYQKMLKNIFTAPSLSENLFELSKYIKTLSWTFHGEYFDRLKWMLSRNSVSAHLCFSLMDLKLEDTCSLEEKQYQT